MQIILSEKVAPQTEISTSKIQQLVPYEPSFEDDGIADFDLLSAIEKENTSETK